MRILVACEYSGIVRDAFAARGHYAMSCDLLPTESPGNHYQGDVFDVVGWDWDMLIGHPPCFHLAISGARHFEAKIADGRQQKALEFVRRLMEVPIPKVCIENPVSIISTHIRKPEQIIQPFWFGDAIQKRTCLWLKGLSPLVYTKNSNLFEESTFVEPEYVIYKSKSKKQGFSKYPVMWGGKHNGHARSKFFPNVAKAMAEQWG